MHHPGGHTPSSLVYTPLAQVTDQASCHYVISVIVILVFSSFLQSHSPYFLQNLCSKLTAVQISQYSWWWRRLPMCLQYTFTQRSAICPKLFIKKWAIPLNICILTCVCAGSNTFVDYSYKSTEWQKLETTVYTMIPSNNAAHRTEITLLLRSCHMIT